MAQIDGLRDIHGRWMQNYQLYPILEDKGLFAKGQLNPDGGAVGINGVYVRVLSLEEANKDAFTRRVRFAHRVLARCDCDRMIPFGKLGQHRKSCDANLYAD